MKKIQKYDYLQHVVEQSKHVAYILVFRDVRDEIDERTRTLALVLLEQFGALRSRLRSFVRRHKVEIFLRNHLASENISRFECSFSTDTLYSQLSFFSLAARFQAVNGNIWRHSAQK